MEEKDAQSTERTYEDCQAKSIQELGELHFLDLAFLVHRLCRYPGGREAHLQQCGGSSHDPEGSQMLFYV